MVPPAKPLLSLTAADLISTSVVLVPAAMSLQAAAHMLAQARVTGAPVVNGAGRCVGVLSATDFVRWADRAGRPPAGPAGADAVCTSWQVVEPEHLPEDAVHNYMTRDPVTAAPATPVGALARMMVDAHIHRVIVADPKGRPVGVVSSTDVLAAVARADGARQPTLAPARQPEPI